jgi:hypothetical protein
MLNERAKGVTILNDRGQTPEQADIVSRMELGHYAARLANQEADRRIAEAWKLAKSATLIIVVALAVLAVLAVVGKWG